MTEGNSLFDYDDMEFMHIFSHTVNNNETPEVSRYERVTSLVNLTHITDNVERAHEDQLLQEYTDCFFLDGDTFEGTNMIEHRIKLNDNYPIKIKQYKFPRYLKDEIEKEIQKMAKAEVIRPSDSPYNSPLWIVPKKADSQGNKR